MSDKIISRFIHLKNKSGVSDKDFFKALDQALLNFGERCLIDYSREYQENPKEFLIAFLKYDSIKMACVEVVKFGRKSGILKELEGKKDFSEWVSKQPLEDKWRGVLEKFLLIFWAVNKVL